MSAWWSNTAICASCIAGQDAVRLLVSPEGIVQRNHEYTNVSRAVYIVIANHVDGVHCSWDAFLISSLSAVDLDRRSIVSR